MKKFIVLSLIGLLVLAFGTMVYAQAKEEAKLNFMASGMFQMRSDVWRWNSNSATGQGGIINVVGSALKPGGAAWDRHAAYMEGRGRLKFDAVMGKEVSGTIFLEIDSTLWGDTPGATGFANRASALTVSERGSFGFWTGDRAAVEVKNLYVDVLSVPFMPVPTSLRIGLQGYGWRTNILGGSDATGITANIKVDPVTFQPVWYKGVEGVTYTADDADLYGLNVFGKYGTFTIGGYGLYFNMNTYPFWSTTYSTSLVTAGLPAADAKIAISQQGTLQAEAWWLGFYADGKVPPVDINFDLAFSNAKVKSKLTPTVADVKYSGWATRLKVDYPWEKFNFGTVLAYGSGADAKKTSKTGYPGETAVGANQAATKVGSYTNLPSGETGSFAESEVFFASYCNDGNTGIGYSNTSNALGRGSIGGIWLAKLYASAKATPWYKVTLQGLYIGDTTKNGNTFGTARTGGLGTYDLRDDKAIGWELDMINEFQIYKSLSYRIGLGVLKPGKALEFYESATKPDEKPKTPWIFTTMLWYTF